MTVVWDMTPSSLVKVGLAVKVRVKQRDKRMTKGCAIQPLRSGSTNYPEEAFAKMLVRRHFIETGGFSQGQNQWLVSLLT